MKLPQVVFSVVVALLFVFAASLGANAQDYDPEAQRWYNEQGYDGSENSWYCVTHATGDAAANERMCREYCVYVEENEPEQWCRCTPGSCEDR